MIETGYSSTEAAKDRSIDRLMAMIEELEPMRVANERLERMNYIAMRVCAVQLAMLAYLEWRTVLGVVLFASVLTLASPRIELTK
jgi:hypothetical protein